MDAGSRRIDLLAIDRNANLVSSNSSGPSTAGTWNCRRSAMPPWSRT